MTALKNTIEIIKALPLDEQTKSDLLTRYPSQMDSDEKRATNDIVWQIYDFYFQIQLQKNLELELEKIKSNPDAPDKVPLDINFETTVATRTHDKMPEFFAQMKDVVELENIRTQMAQA